MILLGSKVANHSGKIWEKKEEQRKSKETGRVATGQQDTWGCRAGCFGEERGAAQGPEPCSAV